MQGLFGQEQARNANGESECKAYSDRTSKKCQWRVRMQGLFGQNKQEMPIESPNARLIRTGQVDIT